MEAATQMVAGLVTQIRKSTISQASETGVAAFGKVGSVVHLRGFVFTFVL